MATLEEASSSSTNTPNFDVYLSFRGSDTRNSFISHLHAALVNDNFKTFYDIEYIGKGEDMGQVSQKAINESRVSIVVLSKNYAYSTWCLDELVLILGQRKNSNQIVIPIFYHVQPSDVRKQQSTYRDAMKKHEKSQLPEKIKEWKYALKYVADLTGYVTDFRPDAEIIKEAVNDIRSLLKPYDVYLSFRATHIHHSFMSHLHKALVNANLKTFYDAEDITKGEKLEQELETAIKASRAYIVVLSKDYAYSVWCLNELVLILEQFKHSNKIVIPIFYHVQPSDVRKQQSTFGDAMEEHEHKMEAEKNADIKSQLRQKNKEWKKALTDVASLSGYHIDSRSDLEIIKQAVKDIRSFLSRYDVFVSFYGPDTRPSFTAHLLKALADANLKTYLDDRIVKAGQNLYAEKISAIIASRASVIVLSMNYASSSLCLDELVLILEQHRSSNHIVIPIFHQVEPTHVRKQVGSFGEAMEKHLQSMKAEKDVARKSQLSQTIEKWKKALTYVANLRVYQPYDTDIRIETEIIEAVVAEICQKLGVVLRSNKPEYFIGMDDHLRDISSWLDDRFSHSADFLTIFGIGGSGKTSLAKYLYGIQCHLFDRSSFIEDISRKCSDQSDKLLILQQQLLSQILEPSSLQANDLSVYHVNIQKALQGIKVLLVLDDVNSLDQLKVLLGNKDFHPGSKIIITTRDASLTNRYIFTQLDQPNHKTLALHGLNENESFQLLCFYAFNGSGPTADYEKLCKKIVKICGGLPLALTVQGSYLCGKDVEEWKSHVERLNHETGSSIRQNLQMSFDALPSRNDKELFLHISCFFVGMDRDITETILNACDISTIFGIRSLVEKSLLTIESTNELMIHPLLQEMGRDVVRQESPKNPGNRSRLWCNEESLEVLRGKQGSTNLLGLTLDMKQEKEKLHEIETDAFSNMENLMLLQLNYVKLEGSYENFPEELRWLCMHGFPSNSIPSDFPMENLVALDLSYSKVESVISPNDERLLGSLKILILSFCEHLHIVSDFFRFPALESLILSNCKGLIEVSESIGDCVELVTLDVSYCSQLKTLPATLRKLENLKPILQDGCNLVILD